MISSSSLKVAVLKQAESLTDSKILISCLSLSSELYHFTPLEGAKGFVLILFHAIIWKIDLTADPEIV